MTLKDVLHRVKRRITLFLLKDMGFPLYREHLSIMLNRLKLNGLGVEVGVGDGAHCEILLKYGSLRKLYLIDWWREYEDQTGVKLQQAQDRNFEIVKKRMLKFGKRYEIIKASSEDASKMFKDETLDFVYIDANHTYESVKKDIGYWYPKVRKNGVLAGHDYWYHPDLKVVEAVNEFVREKKQTLHIIPMELPSWFVVKR